MYNYVRWENLEKNTGKQYKEIEFSLQGQ